MQAQAVDAHLEAQQDTHRHACTNTEAALTGALAGASAVAQQSTGGTPNSSSIDGWAYIKVLADPNTSCKVLNDA